MTYQMTRQQIESLQIGDLLPNCFGEMKPITEIYHKGEDINGKLFACFYQEFGKDATMSNSAKEGEPIFII